MVPPGTAIPVPQLETRLADAWSAGAEEIVDYLVEHGLARLDGDGDAETVTFTAAPDPAHV